jgi:hypothetical protein
MDLECVKIALFYNKDSSLSGIRRLKPRNPTRKEIAICYTHDLENDVY